MKTLFITSFNPFISRNVLLTQAFSNLAFRDDLRIVIFCPKYKKQYFADNFKISDSIIIEGIASQRYDKRDVFFSYIGRSLIDTSTLRVHRKEILLRNKKIHLFLLSCLLAILGRLNIVKKVVRWFDLMSINKKKFSKYYDLYKPNLVFAADVFNVDDVHFLAEAKSRGVKTVGMIRSWDNVTNKGLFRIKPDKLIVNNLIVRDEVLSHEDINDENIFVTGMPQLDFYVNTGFPRLNREDFFRKIGLDPNRRTILIAPHGQRFFDRDSDLLEMLMPLPYQYIVRLPPNDDVKLPDFSGRDFFVDRPGVVFKEGVFNDRELTLEDSLMLGDELFYSDVVINYVSSITIDASFFDKPIINVSFDGFAANPYIKSEKRFLDFTHLRKMFNTGCCRIAYSFKELKNCIAEYLRDPNIDKGNRRKFLYDQALTLDGKSGTRLAEFLVEMLSENN